MAITINEIFYSIQGEGLFSGIATIFIRTTGCNLRCKWCDTTDAYEEGEVMDLDLIVDTVNIMSGEQGHKNLCITGGEPLMQKDVPELVFRFLSTGYSVTLETNGSQFLPSFLQQIHQRTGAMDQDNEKKEVNKEGKIENEEGKKENEEGKIENEEGKIENEEGKKENREGKIENGEGKKENGEGEEEAEEEEARREEYTERVNSNQLSEGNEYEKMSRMHERFMTLRKNLHISLDIKCPSSGEAEKMNLLNLNILSDEDQLKFVVQNWEDLEYSFELLRDHPVFCPAIIQPVMGETIDRSKLQDLAEAFLRGFPEGFDVRFMLQSHKVIWGNRKGV